MNFATMKGLTIPEGVVTQITDASGRVLWKLSVGGPIVLGVEKITSNTYAAETSYTDEQFILLDIYPKTNGTVSVTYGGLTKTITDTSGAENPNAQQVYFGTFNGVSDSVTTPASGELTIEGDYESFATVSFSYSSKNSKYCGCITSVIEWGGITSIPTGAFRGCASLTLAKLPNSITSVGGSAFYGCTALALTSLPSGLTSIGSSAFYGCTALALTSLPSGLTSIGDSAFYMCENLTFIELPSGLTSISSSAFEYCDKLKNITIHGGVTSIGSNAFAYCGNLESVIISEGVKSIGPQAFYMSISEADNALGKQINLREVVLPSTIQSIGYSAFYVSYSGGSACYLDKLTILATTPPTVSEGGYNAKTIIVPKGCGEAYKAAEGWSAYADRIVEAS